jgi:hypothetical protein
VDLRRNQVDVRLAAASDGGLKPTMGLYQSIVPQQAEFSRAGDLSVGLEVHIAPDPTFDPEGTVIPR